MRNKTVFALSVFEHTQFSNWPDAGPIMGAHDIYDAIQPVVDALQSQAKSGELDLSAAFVTRINTDLVETLGGQCRDAQFVNSQGWQDYIAELRASAAPRSVTVQDCGAWIITQLYWDHLQTLRLLTAWLIVDAMTLQEGSQRLFLNSAGLGRLVTHLSDAGPPLYDAEPLRGCLFSLAD